MLRKLKRKNRDWKLKSNRRLLPFSTQNPSVRTILDIKTFLLDTILIIIYLFLVHEIRDENIKLIKTLRVSSSETYDELISIISANICRIVTPP